MNAEDIIARCTRNGVTSWQNVAAQLGRSVDGVRSDYDPAYLKIRPWPHPCEEVAHPDDIELEPADTSSPYAKPEPLKDRILKLLTVQSMSAEILSHALNSPRNSIRARLDRLLDDGKVCHDGKYPRTWGILEADGTPRSYGSGGQSTFCSSSRELEQRVAAKGFHTEIVYGGRRRSVA